MSQTITQGRLRINANFKHFVDEEVLPGTGLDAAAFWRNFDEIVHDLAPENRQLLAERDRIQAALDEWHRSNPGPVKDKAAYKSFLRELGYLVPQPERVTVETTGFDRLWPQLVERGLVKHKEFQAILNKTEFKYSPQTSLTDKQIATLTNIVNAIHTSASQNNERQKRLGPYFWKVMQEPERRSLHPLCSITLRRTLISTESKSVWYFPILPHEVN